MLLLDRLRFTLTSLLQLFDQRQRGQDEKIGRLDRNEEAVRDEAEKVLHQQKEKRDQELAELDRTYEQETHQLKARSTAEDQALQRTYAAHQLQIDEEEKQTQERLQAELKDALWTADSLLEAGQKRIQEQLDTHQHKVKEVRERSEKLWTALQPLLKRYGIEREELQPEKEVPASKGDSLRDVDGFLDKGQERVTDALELRLLGWISLPMQLGMSLWLLLLGAAPALFLKPWSMWLGSGMGVALGAILLQRQVLIGMIYNRLWDAGEKLAVLLIQAQRLSETLLARTTASSKVQTAQIQQQHVADRKKAEARFRPQIEQVDAGPAVNGKPWSRSMPRPGWP